jgi:uncharacterized protein (DUF2252 family)
VPAGGADSSSAIARIARYNAGREPERLALKYSAMRRDPFAFLRGTAHLFWEDWQARYGLLDDTPLVWGTGDLHLENVGSCRGDNRLVYFDLNDFDEGARVPASWEIARFVTSIHVAAESLGVTSDATQVLAVSFLEAYDEARADGKARWVERAVATGMVKELLERVKGRTREALLDTRTTLRRDRRALRVDGRKVLPIRERDRAMVTHAVEQLARAEPKPRFFEVLDVGRRVAGTASLGLERYVILVRGTGSPDGNWLLDLKEAHVSPLAALVTQPACWANEAERVIGIQHRMQAICPALLRPLAMHDKSYVLRELQPTEDRLALEHWHGKVPRLRRVMVTIGHLVAWAQLRSASRNGAAVVDELIAFGKESRWHRELLRAAKAYSVIVQRDWRQFTRASDDSYHRLDLP